MQIQLEKSLIDRLTSKGVLAYVAVKMADGTEATTAALASLVRAQTAAMLEGLKELAVEAPGAVAKVKNKWRCGLVKAGDGEVIQAMDSNRYRDFMDDLKKFWDFVNKNGDEESPMVPFAPTPRDCSVIRRFVNDHGQWTAKDWRTALQNRAYSILRYSHASSSEAFGKWIDRLGDYSAGPLDKYNRPAEGNGKHGEAADVRERNRAAVNQAVSNA